MKADEVMQRMGQTNIARMNLMGGKRNDYADEDALSNFKRMQQLCEILDIQPSKRATDCARFLMLLKIDRWCNLSRKGVNPLNESVRDSILDLHNYIDLAEACEFERNREVELAVATYAAGVGLDKIA